ncbi:MAG: S-methyl-5-thioribose-1-phosphate isomerase [Firmicutes bacterium]|nr:S-methyl-5-thioribose-1-phosphate isomerase [Bacillota bacterium]
MSAIRVTEGKIELLDQRKLPTEITYMVCTSWQDVATAIKDMVVRGAPAIGAAAAYGMALAAKALQHLEPQSLLAGLEEAALGLKATRPTAVNLAWAVERMLHFARKQNTASAVQLAELLWAEADKIAAEDVETNKKIGQYGAQLIPPKARILTHCNAGALATVGYGTALGVIRSAVAQGKEISVFVDETRPYLQGSRLTAWELQQEQIPTTLIADNMAGFLMQKGEIDLVIVGADRIAANGDVANKIGTYSLAVLAQAHKIPFYVAAPLSTFDLQLSSGQEIPIEERSAQELTHFAGVQIAPTGIKCYNPAFDVTPAALVTAIITEAGIIKNPDTETIKKFFTE